MKDFPREKHHVEWEIKNGPYLLGAHYLGWWRRGRVELPVQKKRPRVCYRLSQLFHLTWLTSADRV